MISHFGLSLCWLHFDCNLSHMHAQLRKTILPQVHAASTSGIGQKRHDRVGFEEGRTLRPHWDEKFCS